MPVIPVMVHHTRRFHLVRFHRATTGNPDEKCPDPDDRGYNSPEFGPVVGVLVGRTVKVRMTRLALDNAAPLFVKSSDEATFKVHAPATGRVPNGAFADIEITGVAGGNPKTANLEVHFNSLTGPIVHVLTVHVYTELKVSITPHLVTVAQAGAPAGTAGITSVANVAAIMPLVRAVWVHYGVTFTVGSTINETLTLATAGEVGDAELATVLGTNWVPSSINVYLVPQFTPDPTSGGVTLGYGFSRTSFSTFGMPNPGILLADGGPGVTRTVMTWANDLAHEIGHFFTLWHPENKQDPDERKDTWSRRSLMHNYNEMEVLGGWRDNVDYGVNLRGCFVSIKDLTHLTTDAECATARTAISGPSGPY